MKLRFFLFSLVFFIANVSFCAITTKKNIILDFGGVLFFTDKKASFKNLGAFTLARYVIRERVNPLHVDFYVRKKLFFILNQIGMLHPLTKENPYQPVYDEHGIELPLIMNAWLSGNITCSYVRLLVNKEIDQHPEWFSSTAEKKIIQNTINMIFTPSLFAGSRSLSPYGIAFIKRCKKEGHKVYALSNWDSESFIVLQQMYPDFFSLFDGIIISGRIHSNKPDHAIYHALMQQYNLIADTCWLIDDQKENIAAAQQLGMHGILYQHSFAHVIKNIRLMYAQSREREKNLIPTGMSKTTTKSSTTIIMEGENIPRIDPRDANPLPAQV